MPWAWGMATADLWERPLAAKGARQAAAVASVRRQAGSHRRAKAFQAPGLGGSAPDLWERPLAAKGVGTDCLGLPVSS
ncbi:hypothetical protein SAMN05444515_10795 [Ectothiorhodospira marina]|uniref:Uncharacterized protein n=1 Tax=Ectothiorhodospira marina TaxID=1396821 RepID=A0A1H7LCR1_9GAMM|nr:hypothetical protein SAMN05444515_10795 [Ectothiorhodospira marina]